MTPGPVAVARDVCRVQGSGRRGAVATLGVALPSLLIILSISGIYMRFQRLR